VDGKAIKCPTCKTTLIKAAFTGGGYILRNRYIHVRDSGELVIACPQCKTQTTSANLRVVKREGR